MSYIPTTHDIVLCHGLMGFGSVGPLDYFKGVADDLKRLGCTVFVSEVSMVDDIKTRAGQLHTQINSYLSHRYGSAKDRSVHLICHSMGGLDARRLVHKDPKPEYNVLSITTVSTPHRGSPVSAWSESLNFFAKITAAPLLAIVHQCAPALKDLRPENMKVFNRTYPDVAGIKYFSVAAKFDPWRTHVYRLSHAFISDFSKDPMNRDAFGPNDGMVSVSSAKWGEFLDFVRQDTSHFGVLGWELMPGGLGGANSDFDAKRLYRQLVDNVARKVEGKAE
ncbi:Alpha/Beta hydrolase protein [Boletus edulis BED1]|uniref:GPI inositol-deacylase n=1 Tax=Boletus edulis BED1 TaxID=1328754 RepID=A0AAD4BGQ6_BOLED|nr:Alpha/Beta hydrolase protein [Boletus edulis BED1]